MENSDKFDFSRLGDELLAWYSKNGRSFPWRKDPSKYEVLLSEILLQQTFARKVVPIYLELNNKYPSLEYLVNADPDEIRDIIQPLGLLYRSDLLVRLATQINDEYGGEIPCDSAHLLSLYGVGAYISAAILCHCCDKKIIPIDTNISRIICRIYGLEYPVRLRETSLKVQAICEGIANTQTDIRSLHYAFLDFAAEICTFYKPKCSTCPFISSCKYALSNNRSE